MGNSQHKQLVFDRMIENWKKLMLYLRDRVCSPLARCLCSIHLGFELEVVGKRYFSEGFAVGVAESDCFVLVGMRSSVLEVYC